MPCPVRRRRLFPPRAAAFAAAGLLLSALAAPASQEPPTAPAIATQEAAGEPVPLAEAAAPARFLIETLTVEGAKKTLARIVAAETLLEEGATYTEADLRQAVARVHRLPFVVDATFALQKGSERGAYELVIRVEPARWFFFDYQSLVSWTDFPDRYGRERDGSFETQKGLVGARIFLGRSGVLFGSTGLSDDNQTSATQIGYTQYDLFGRGVVATVSYASDYFCCGVVDDSLFFLSDRERSQFGLDLAIPLSRFHALQIDWTERRDEVDLVRFSDDLPNLDLESRTVELRWVRDTSDDPLLPRHGSVYSVGLEYSQAETFFSDALPGEGPTFFDTERLTVDLTATRHWPLTSRQSVSAGGRLFYQTADAMSTALLPETDRVGGTLSARHLFRLWTLREPGNLGDLYLETGASFGTEHLSSDRGGVLFDDRERLELSSALIYRSQWGRVRLNFAFSSEEER